MPAVDFSQQRKYLRFLFLPEIFHNGLNIVRAMTSWPRGASEYSTRVKLDIHRFGTTKAYLTNGGLGHKVKTFHVFGEF